MKRPTVIGRKCEQMVHKKNVMALKHINTEMQFMLKYHFLPIKFKSLTTYLITQRIISSDPLKHRNLTILGAVHSKDQKKVKLFSVIISIYSISILFI